MNLIEIMARFPTQETCIKHLEKIRWGDNPQCPHCESIHVAKRKEIKLGRIGRWNCYECKSAFKVTCGTVFHGTKISLQKWFLAIALMVNAKKSLSSCQLARDLGMKQKSAWRLMMRIRAEMAKESTILEGIVEVDETYIGGKHRKNYSREDGKPRKRGRGTAKDAVIGAVQRGGQVVAQIVPNTTGKTISGFIKEFVNIKDTKLFTDKYRGYNEIGKEMEHETLNRSEKWQLGEVHTNTIEGFWSFVKRVWYGQHHHYSTEYTQLYIAEACYKYNYRDIDVFAKFIGESVSFSI